MAAMTNEPLGSELKRFLQACAGDPDKLAAFEAYVSLLAARDEAADDGDSTASLERRKPAIAAARAELRHLLSDLK